MQYFTNYQSYSILILSGPMDELALDGPEWELKAYNHQN